MDLYNVCLFPHPIVDHFINNCLTPVKCTIFLNNKIMFTLLSTVLLAKMRDFRMFYIESILYIHFSSIKFYFIFSLKQALMKS